MNELKEITDLPCVDCADLMPKETGIYFIMDGKELLYVGKAKNLYKRCQSYKHYFIIKPTIKIYYKITKNNIITMYERKLIKKYKPKLNIADVDNVNNNRSMIKFRLNEKLYDGIMEYCINNNTTVSEHSRALWEKELSCL